MDMAQLVRYEASNKFDIEAPDDNEGIIVKGFISVNIPDRSREMVDPSAFDIPSYMAQPALLVNHNLWTTREGNKIGVGKALSIAEVKLRNSDDPTMYSVYDVNAKKEIDKFPKNRNPNLSLGTRGLYGFFKVTEPDVVKKVKDGELSGFSWRGNAKPEYIVDPKTNSAYKSYAYIDMWEVSLVTAPNNFASSFVVAKDAIHSVWFDKAKYDVTQVQQYLELQHLPNYSIVDGITRIYAHDKSLQDKWGKDKNLVVVKMTEDMGLFVGQERPCVGEEKLQPQTMDMKELDTFYKTVKEVSMPATTEPVVTTVPAATVPVATTSATPVVAATSTVETPAVAPIFNEGELISKAVDAVLLKLNPVLEGISKTVQALALTTDELVKKSTTPPTPVEPPPPAPTEVLADVQKQFELLTKKFETVEKGLSAVTPSTPSRQETTTTTSTAPASKPDPNSVFNSFFGIKNTKVAS